MSHKTLLRLLAITALAAGVSACAVAGAAPASGKPPVDTAQATSIAQNALEGYNSGDFEVWSRDWSPTMRAAIKDADFQAARQELMTVAGRFLSIDGSTYAQTRPGVHRYTFAVTFEKRSGTVWFGFAEGSQEVEGVKFE